MRFLPLFLSLALAFAPGAGMATSVALAAKTAVAQKAVQKPAPKPAPAPAPIPVPKPAPEPTAPTPVVSTCGFHMLSGMDALNFVARIRSCNVDDLKAALADATAKKDAIGVACLGAVVPLFDAVLEDQTGVLLAFQLFRDVQLANGISNCEAYVATTIKLTTILIPKL